MMEVKKIMKNEKIEEAGELLTCPSCEGVLKMARTPGLEVDTRLFIPLGVEPAASLMTWG